jgi:uncharacterized membrane protein HdeD (DUF308 family)
MLDLLDRTWWSLLIRGIVAILFGIVLFIWPDVALESLIIVFGIFAIVDGILSIVSALMEREGDRWWLVLLFGIVGIIAGLIAIFATGLTAVTLFYLIAAYAIVGGIIEIFTAIEVRKAIEDEWLYIIQGVLSVIFGFLLIRYPALGIFALVAMISVFAMFQGVIWIIMAFRVRDIKSKLESA